MSHVEIERQRAPRAPLRRVSSRVQHPNYTTDTLECGHTVTDRENRWPVKRRCRDCAGNPFLQWIFPGGEYGSRARRFRATGEFRPPRCGEWYLSGAIVEAYRAPSDFNRPFFIAKEERKNR